MGVSLPLTEVATPSRAEAAVSEVEIPQYRRGAILAVWAAAVVRSVVGPRDSRVDDMSWTARPVRALRSTWGWSVRPEGQIEASGSAGCARGGGRGG